MSQDDKNFELTQKALYEKLERLYENNGYYEHNLFNHSKDIYNRVKPAYIYNHHIKPLRTVVNRSVEFYVSKICQSLQVSSEFQEIIDSVNQVLTWSNFSATKAVSLRQDVLYGNLFWKVTSDGKKVYFETIDPKYISELELDNRGYIQSIRIDIPLVDEFNRDLTYTEYWNKEYFAVWKHSLGENATLDMLGEPIDTGWLIELGIDFIPIVQIKFKNIGDKWGTGSVFHCLDKIDEANKEASRLSDLIFRYNKNTMVVSANDKDANGRPIPAPKVKEEEDIFKENIDSILYLNGMATINSLIPNIQYDAALSILNAMMDELNNDLPELKYYSLKEGNLSGKAIRLMLAGAIDRAKEAQDNFIQGLDRVIKIALTLGNYWGIFNIQGNYENGSFDYSLLIPDLFPMDESEKSTMLKDYTASGLALATSLKLIGYDDAFIIKALEEKQSQESQTMTNAQNSLGTALSNFNSGV